MDKIIIRSAICLSFYIVGAYATTDILRLLKGNSAPVNTPDCYCPICHNKIALKDQLPIFSYAKNHGTCFYCKSPIPVSDIFLEIFLFFSLTGISFLLDFSWLAFLLCVLFYETTKLIFILIFGRREYDFFKNLFISLRNNLFTFSLIGILFLLANII